MDALQSRPASFEEYVYWAKATRRDESHQAPPGEKGPRTSDGGALPQQQQHDTGRSMRTAGWGAIFYLITADVFGPFSTPWAFAQMGYGPGIAIFTVFGVLSTYSGWIIWNAYLGLDSARYPLREYGDFFLRLFGRLPRRLVNICQSLQLILTVSIIILLMGQSLSQMSRGPGGGQGVCFVTCLVVFAAAGSILGQVRTLRRFSWLAFGAVGLNCVIMLLCVGVVVNSPPNFVSTMAQYGPDFGPGPIAKFAGFPPDGYASGGLGFVGTLNGLLQAVFAYGGCMLFVAFLAEMRQPRDFWKALVCAELFIYILYVAFGLFVYSFQGQFALNPAMQGLSPYRWQTVANALSIGAYLVVGTLFANVGLKLFYIDILQEFFHFPDLTSVRGRVYWAVLTPTYWALAFVICATVPMFSFVSGFIGAAFILSFTFTFPALIALGYTIKRDAMVEGEERFDPETRTYSYKDRGFKRFRRAFMKRPILNTWNAIYFLGALTTCVLGVYSSVVALIGAFSGKSAATSWGCVPPV
ncbi:transmembrane amino acid transporter [Lasiosphaeria hispida]|uniref:Transmembrane amino acid transporter n=1 Tax=Lasiosphaeria hispida TaxID=260671 RepID=A0AAJ0H7T3_9PEZI|nr:transmembrane amino acid transporter [Lasiosphaeria hispida]